MSLEPVTVQNLESVSSQTWSELPFFLFVSSNAWTCYHKLASGNTQDGRTESLAHASAPTKMNPLFCVNASEVSVLSFRDSSVDRFLLLAVGSACRCRKNRSVTTDSVTHIAVMKELLVALAPLCRCHVFLLDKLSSKLAAIGQCTREPSYRSSIEPAHTHTSYQATNQTTNQATNLSCKPPIKPARRQRREVAEWWRLPNTESVALLESLCWHSLSCLLCAWNGSHVPPSSPPPFPPCPAAFFPASRFALIAFQSPHWSEIHWILIKAQFALSMAFRHISRNVCCDGVENSLICVLFVLHGSIGAVLT